MTNEATASLPRDGVTATPAVRRRTIWNGNNAAPLASLALAVVVLIAWQYLPPALGVPKYIIPQVSDLWCEGVRMWNQENLLRHFISTASMSILGFVLGGLLGAAFGYALGLLPTWEKVLSPYILALQIAPKVAFAPLFILWFGYNALAEADHRPSWSCSFRSSSMCCRRCA